MFCRRRPDGIHWNTDAVRHITNLILTHIGKVDQQSTFAICLILKFNDDSFLALSWGRELPGNFKSPIVEKNKNLIPEPIGNEKQMIENLNEISKNLQPSNKNDQKNNNYTTKSSRGRSKRRKNNNNNNNNDDNNYNYNYNNLINLTGNCSNYNDESKFWSGAPV